MTGTNTNWRKFFDDNIRRDKNNKQVILVSRLIEYLNKLMHSRLEMSKIDQRELDYIKQKFNTIDSQVLDRRNRHIHEASFCNNIIKQYEKLSDPE